MENKITNNYVLKESMKIDTIQIGIILGFLYVSEFIVTFFLNSLSSSIVYLKYILLCIYLVFAFNKFGKTSYKKLLVLSFKLSLIGGIIYVLFYLFFTFFIDKNYEKSLFEQFVNQSIQAGQDNVEITKLINTIIKYKVLSFIFFLQVIFQTFIVSLIVSFFYSKEVK